MDIRYQADLQPLNTFGLAAQAEALVTIHSVDDLRQQLASCKQPLHILGGGSNVLLTQNLAGTVLLNQILGKEVVFENEEEVHLALGGGEPWHEAVLFAVEHHWGGIENLSLIPGTVGAAPIQNIGAYGVELKDVFLSLEAVHLATGKTETFTALQCAFGYRDSIFKREAKNKYLIARVVLRLSKNPVPKTTYGPIQEELERMGCAAQPTIQEVSEAIIRIRRSKLPDPKEIGNAGSFFKNPVVQNMQYDEVKEKYPDMPSYDVPEGKKIPAGWLIEQCGWKGFQKGSVGVHAKQALVLVHFGGAKGSDILQLAEEIIDSVQQKFGIRLQPEVNIW